MEGRVEFDPAAERELGKVDPQIARRILAFLQDRLVHIDNPRSVGKALKGSTRADIAAVAANLERLERHVEANMATKADLATLRTATKAGLTALRADLYRALWLQGGALAGLILVLAGYALTS